MERTQCQHLGQNVAEDIEAALSILFHLADLLDRLLHALGYLFFDVPDIILNGQQVRRLAGNGPARLQNRRSAEGYFVLASTWYDFLRDNKNVLEEMSAAGGEYDGNPAYLPRVGYAKDEVFKHNEILKKKLADLWIKVKNS